MKAIKPVHRRQEGFTLIYVLCFLFLAIGLVAIDSGSQQQSPENRATAGGPGKGHVRG